MYDNFYTNLDKTSSSIVSNCLREWPSSLTGEFALIFALRLSMHALYWSWSCWNLFKLDLRSPRWALRPIFDLISSNVNCFFVADKFRWTIAILFLLDVGVDSFASSSGLCSVGVAVSAFFSTALNTFVGVGAAFLRGDNEPPNVNFTIFCCFVPELDDVAVDRFDNRVTRSVAAGFSAIFAVLVVDGVAEAEPASTTFALLLVAIARSNKVFARSEDGVGASNRLSLWRELIISSVAALFRAVKNDVIDGEDIFNKFQKIRFNKIK